jgi:8-oxo-dGTP pyrophosphatase MutT (NUDIX family)
MSTSPRIVNPQAARIVSLEAPPAVEPARLAPSRLRERFAAPPSWTPELPGDGGLFPGREIRDAAVLVPLVHRDDGLRVLLTQRTAHLHDHAGQISFPGGRRDPEDTSLEATALREAHEEVGLKPSQIELLGRLSDYQTVTAYRVTPVVALVHPPVVLATDSFEVADVFEVPLAFLVDPRNHQRRAIDTPVGERHFFAMPWTDPLDPEQRERFIWGATAAMLRNFYRFLSA